MLDDREQIRDNLTGMRAIRQPIDDGHCRMASHLLNLFMIIGAQHDRIHHTAEDARRIRHALAAPQLA